MVSTSGTTGGPNTPQKDSTLGKATSFVFGVAGICNLIVFIDKFPTIFSGFVKGFTDIRSGTSMIFQWLKEKFKNKV